MRFIQTARVADKMLCRCMPRGRTIIPVHRSLARSEGSRLTRRPCVRTRPATKARCRLTPAAAAATAEFVIVELVAFFLLRRVLELFRADCRGTEEGTFRLGRSGRAGAKDCPSSPLSCSGVAYCPRDVVLVDLGGVSWTTGADVATVVVPDRGPGLNAAPFSMSSAGLKPVTLLSPEESWAASLVWRAISASPSSDSWSSSSPW